MAGSALLGGGVGLVGGRARDAELRRRRSRTGERSGAAAMPIATVMPMRDASGATVPAFAAMGSF